MMSNQIINTDKAPAPIGPYNQAVLSAGFLFISGQIALVPGSSEIAAGSVTEETTQVMKNLSMILEEAGMSFSHVVKTTIFLSDMSLFSEVNEVYARSFTGNYPARETVAVKGLPRNVRVEISMIASK